MGIPVVKGHLEKDSDDNISGLNQTHDETGLGNITLSLANEHTWNDGDDFLRADIEVDLPTDSRDAPFDGGAGGGRVSLIGERFRDDRGLLGLLALNYVLGEGDEESDLSLEYQLGVSRQMSSYLFALLVGGESDIVRLEFNTEYTLESGRILEFFIGKDLSGFEEAFFTGLAINF